MLGVRMWLAGEGQEELLAKLVLLALADSMDVVMGEEVAEVMMPVPLV